MRAIRIAVGAFALAAALAPAVHAQDVADVKRLTILSFTAPVQLPGVTLPAGKYRFEIADINNAAHTVRVLSEDGQKVHATVQTVPSTLPQRDLRDQETLLMFAERPAGMAQAAREWFYPGRSIGEEFVYPRDQAVAIANANCTSVAADDEGKIVRVEGCEKTAAQTGVTTTQTETAAAAEPATAPAAAPTAAPEATTAREETTTARADVDTTAPAPASSPASTSAPASRQEARSEVGTAGQVESQGAAQGTQAAADQRELPRTSSQLGLLVTLSVLLIAAAIGMRQLRRGVVK